MTLITLNGAETITLSDLAAGVPVERDARLLVAGDYPGKNLHVTEADLDALVAHFSDPVPVKVEHIDSPLDPLGHVKKIWRDGGQLMGKIVFPAAMAAFLSQRGAAKLSVGLLKEPAWQLLETSLTLSPHVPSATLLSDTERAELVTLRAGRLDAQITVLKAAGKIVPASESFARALLGVGDTSLVTLSDGTSAGLAQAFLGFLAAQPPVVALGELARVPHGGTTLSGAAAAADPDMDGEPELTAEHAAVCQRMGVDPKDVAKTLHTDRTKKGTL